MRTYPTDLSDAEFRHIEPHLPAANQRGRPKIHAPREILNAVFYVLKSGCPWRLLPRNFPPWKTVYHWFSELGASTGRGSGSTRRCASA
jgi:putative transposase